MRVWRGRSLLRVAGYLETQRVLFGIESLTELAGEIYRKEHASLNARRGSRGDKVLGSPYPRLHRKLDLT